MIIQLLNFTLLILTWTFIVVNFKKIREDAFSIQTYRVLIKYSFLGVWEFIRPFLKWIILVIAIITGLIMVFPGILENVEKILQTKNIWIEANSRPSFLLTLFDLIIIAPFKLLIRIAIFFLTPITLLKKDWFTSLGTKGILSGAVLGLWVLALRKAYKEELIHHNKAKVDKQGEDLEEIKKELLNGR